ncbi:MAG: hypothetical protein CBB72_011830 [Muricauda sp. TMED12]|nr:MAG: hypothetical protein CBB72_011830 [Muricauda sp. TMED12]
MAKLEMSQDLSVTNQQRLDRIETKIDKLSETVISLARAEEKLVALETDREETRKRLTTIETAVNVVDRKVDEYAVTVKVINRLFWIVITVTASVLAGTFLM